MIVKVKHFKFKKHSALVERLQRQRCPLRTVDCILILPPHGVRTVERCGHYYIDPDRLEILWDCEIGSDGWGYYLDIHPAFGRCPPEPADSITPAPMYDHMHPAIRAVMHCMDTAADLYGVHVDDIERTYAYMRQTGRLGGMITVRRPPGRTRQAVDHIVATGCTQANAARLFGVDRGNLSALYNRMTSIDNRPRPVPLLKQAVMYMVEHGCTQAVAAATFGVDPSNIRRTMDRMRRNGEI